MATKRAAGGKVTFRVKLEGSGPKGTWIAIVLPARVHTTLGGDRARIPVVGTADGQPIRTSAAPMGGVHLFPFNKQMQKATGKGVGDTVTFAIERDEQPRTVKAPADLTKALAKHAAAKKAFAALSYSHKKEYVQWIEEAKREDTRARRIEKAVAMIAEGKRQR